MSGTASTGQDPDAQTAPVQDDPQAASQTQGASGPWANDLATRFEDEGVRTAVDEFLRETVQPYVTRLEQDRNPDADRLYDELQSNPGQTFLAITEELWGEDAAQAVHTALLDAYGEDGPDEPVTPPASATSETPPAAATPPAGDTPPALDPRVEALLQEREEQARRDAYEAELSRVKGANPDVKVVDTLFAPFVLATNGNFDAAFEGYKQWLTTAQTELAGAPATEEVPQDVPPAALGSDTAGGAAPPTQKRYGSLDDAMDDFFAEQKSSAPPPVGTT